MKKSHSSKQWLRRHVNDPFVQRSKREGYRSRSAYKLTEIDDRDRLLKGGQLVVDLGSAPGGWSQVLSQRVPSGRIVAVDLLEMAPVPGVTFVQTDFGTRRGLEAVEAAMAGRKADVVLSDISPNLSGIGISDQARSMGLSEIALEFALAHLQPDGAFLVKVFQGAGYDDYLRAMRSRFTKVVVRKPEASRDESAEQYLLGRGLKPVVAAAPQK